MAGRADVRFRIDPVHWQEAVRRLEVATAAARPRAERARGHDAVVRAMREPGFYDPPPARVEVRETAFSWVFLAGEKAYKIKKPIVLPFLDYGTRERRRHFCREEVRLNRRLAPTVYLGVRAIVVRDGGPALADGDADDAVEYAVEMRRFDERDTLAAAIDRDRVTLERIARLGGVLADFHARATARRRADAELAHLKHQVNGNFEILMPCAAVLGHARVAAAERFATSFLAARAAIVLLRSAGGFVREGHGDLRAEHVLLEGDRIEVVDGVEFDAELRELDVGADLSFLVMDLIRLDRPELATALVTAYREAGGDPGGDEMVAFHAAVRAWVRAKVACVRAGEPTAPDAERHEALTEARAFFELGERLSWRARLPLLLIVCGPPGSGKSSLAASLADISGLRVVSSDVTRKRLAGLASAERAPDDTYTKEAGRETYLELGRLAAQRVADDGGAIVDATFHRRHERDAFREGLGPREAPQVFVECQAPLNVLTARAQWRSERGPSDSDATPEVAARLQREFEALDEVAPGSHVIVRTDRLPAEIRDDVVAALDRRLDRVATAA